MYGNMYQTEVLLYLQKSFKTEPYVANYLLLKALPWHGANFNMFENSTVVRRCGPVRILVFDFYGTVVPCSIKLARFLVLWESKSSAVWCAFYFLES